MTTTSSPSNLLTLVLGGTRSGKSVFAEEYLLKKAPAQERPYSYIATSQMCDEEMRLRVEKHQARRTRQNWATIEAPIDLPTALITLPNRPALVDCLTLWLTNLIMAGHDCDAYTTKLIEALTQRRAATVLIANEVGLGIVPQNALARRFRDEAGLLNQKIAHYAGNVFFVAAGLPLTLKTVQH